MAFQQTSVSYAGKLRIEKDAFGMLWAYYFPAGLPSEPQNLVEHRVMNHQELKGHLIKFDRYELLKLCQKHHITCGSSPSKTDLIRAVSSACIRPHGVEIGAKPIGAMHPLEKNEAYRVMSEKVEKDKKKHTPMEWKQLTAVAKKMCLHFRDDPKFKEAWNSLTFDEIKALPELLREEGVFEDSATDEEQIAFDEEQEEEEEEEETLVQSEDEGAEIEDQENDIPEEMMGEKIDISIANFHNKEVIFSGAVPDRQRIGKFLVELQDLMAVREGESLEICTQTEVRVHPQMPIKDAVKITQNASFYMRVRGLAGGAGGGKNIIRTISKARVQKHDFFKNKAVEFYADVKDAGYSCEILKDAKGVADYVFSSIGNGQAIYQTAINQLDVEKLTECIDIMTAGAKRGSTENKLEKICGIVLGRLFSRLEKRQEEIDAVRASIVCSMVASYAQWSWKGGKIDNGAFVKMLTDRKAVIEEQARASGEADMEELSKLLGKAII